MRYLLITLLMFTAPLSWGESSYFCTLERSIYIDENSENIELGDKQRIVSISEDKIIVRGHGTDYFFEFERLPDKPRYIIGKQSKDRGAGLEIRWFLDKQDMSLQRVVTAGFATHSEWGKCTKI